MHPPTKPPANEAARPVPPQQPSEDVTAVETAGQDLAAKVAKPIVGYAPRRPIRTDNPASISLILALALPTIVEQLISAGVGLTDTIVAGHIAGTDGFRTAATAAVGTMSYLQWFSGLMTSALGVGATAIVARSIGARRPRVANRVAGTACTAAFLVGLLVAAFFFFFPDQICAWAKLEGDAGILGAQYLRIMALTVCLQTTGQIGMACLRGAGDTIRPMLVTLTVVCVNTIATPALTFGWFGLPRMGIKGNATGTLIAFAMAGILSTIFLFSGTAGIKLRLRHIRIVPHVLQRVVRIGLPSWFENMLLWVGQFVIVIFVISPTDQAVGISGVTMAAHTAVLRIESLAFLPGFGLGIAAAALVGQYLGAGKPAESHRAAILSNRLACIMMGVAAIPMVFLPRFMLGLIVDSAPVVQAGTVPMILAGLAQPGFAIAIIMGWSLKGAGDTITPMLSTVTGMVLRMLFVFPIVAFFKHLHHPEWGLTAVWICIFADLNYRAFFTGIVFRRGKWQNHKV